MSRCGFISDDGICCQGVGASNHGKKCPFDEAEQCDQLSSVDKKSFTIQDVGDEITSLTVKKNAAYGDSYARSADILRILYPDGVRPDQYEDLLGMARLIDKQFRIANNKDAFGESPWRDIAGYGLVASAADAARKLKVKS